MGNVAVLLAAKIIAPCLATKAAVTDDDWYIKLSIAAQEMRHADPARLTTTTKAMEGFTTDVVTLRLSMSGAASTVGFDVGCAEGWSEGLHEG